MIPDTSRWAPVGETRNTRYFQVERGILACVPKGGISDTRETALENREFQTELFRGAGAPGVTIVFFDLMKSQDKEARRVYQAMDPRHLCGTALVGGSLLGRAIASFFLGVLAKPGHPVKMFASEEEAIAWARQLIAERAAPHAEAR